MNNLSPQDCNDLLNCVDFALKASGLKDAKRLIELAEKLCAIRDTPTESTTPVVVP